MCGAGTIARKVLLLQASGQESPLYTEPEIKRPPAGGLYFKTLRLLRDSRRRLRRRSLRGGRRGSLVQNAVVNGEQRQLQSI